jgi:hypothetical protein
MRETLGAVPTDFQWQTGLNSAFWKAFPILASSFLSESRATPLSGVSLSAGSNFDRMREELQD